MSLNRQRAGGASSLSRSAPGHVLPADIADQWAVIPSRLLALPTLQRHGLVALGLFVLVSALSFPLLWLPHFWDSLTFVAGADHILTHGFSPALPLAEDYGHPVLLLEIIAVVRLIFGDSLLAAHAVILLFAFTMLYFTYLVGDYLYGAYAGVLAAVLLAFYPLFRGQSTQVLLDMPAGALGMVAIYYFLRGRPAPYLLAASAMVLTKATSVVLVPAILLYILIKFGRTTTFLEFIKKLALYSFPIIVTLAWFLYHYSLTGWISVSDNMGRLDQQRPLIDLLAASVPSVSSLFAKYLASRFLLGILTVLIVYCCIFLFKSIGPPDNLALLIAPTLFTLALMSVTIALHRYLIVSYPLFFILAAHSLHIAVSDRKIRHAIVAIILAVFVYGWSTSRLGSDIGSPSTSAFTDFIDVHRQAAAFIESYYPHQTILAGWPQYIELTMPMQGYVTRPHRIVAYAQLDRHYQRIIGLGGRPFSSPDSITRDDFDLLYYSGRTGYKLESEMLLKLVQRFRLVGIAQFRRGQEYATIYGFP